jgi:hypothetical protein
VHGPTPRPRAGAAIAARRRHRGRSPRALPALRGQGTEGNEPKLRRRRGLSPRARRCFCAIRAPFATHSRAGEEVCSLADIMRPLDSTPRPGRRLEGVGALADIMRPEKSPPLDPVHQPQRGTSDSQRICAGSFPSSPNRDHRTARETASPAARCGREPVAAERAAPRGAGSARGPPHRSSNVTSLRPLHDHRPRRQRTTVPSASRAVARPQRGVPQSVACSGASPSPSPWRTASAG